MSDIKNDPDLKPSDHILDDFLHELGAATTWDVGRRFLADLREALAREALSDWADRVQQKELRAAVQEFAEKHGIELEDDYERTESGDLIVDYEPQEENDEDE